VARTSGSVGGTVLKLSRQRSEQQKKSAGPWRLADFSF
jgi:hypothetical protein